MGVPLDQLPADVRRQIEADHGISDSGHRDEAHKTGNRRKPSRTPGGNHTPGHCHTPGCDWTGTDRHDHTDDCRKTKPCDCFLSHAAATGHARFEMEVS